MGPHALSLLRSLENIDRQWRVGRRIPKACEVDIERVERLGRENPGSTR